MLNIARFFLRDDQFNAIFDKEIGTDGTIDLSHEKLGHQLNAEILRRLPKYLLTHPNVTSLNLSFQGNNCSGTVSIEKIFSKIAIIPHLKVVNMSSCGISDATVQFWQKILRSTPSILH